MVMNSSPIRRAAYCARPPGARTMDVATGALPSATYGGVWAGGRCCSFRSAEPSGTAGGADDGGNSDGQRRGGNVAEVASAVNHGVQVEAGTRGSQAAAGSALQPKLLNQMMTEGRRGRSWIASRTSYGSSSEDSPSSRWWLRRWWCSARSGYRRRRQPSVL